MCAGFRLRRICFVRRHDVGRRRHEQLRSSIGNYTASQSSPPSNGNLGENCTTSGSVSLTGSTTQVNGGIDYEARALEHVSARAVARATRQLQRAGSSLHADPGDDPDDRLEPRRPDVRQLHPGGEQHVSHGQDQRRRLDHAERGHLRDGLAEHLGQLDAQRRLGSDHRVHRVHRHDQRAASTCRAARSRTRRRSRRTSCSCCRTTARPRRSAAARRRRTRCTRRAPTSRSPVAARSTAPSSARASRTPAARRSTTTRR